MSGWILIENSNRPKAILIDVLNNKFQNDKIGAIQSRLISTSKTCSYLTWGWRAAAFNEEHIINLPEEEVSIILNGYILDFGNFGGSIGNQNELIMMLRSMYKSRSLDEIVKELNGSFSIIQANSRTKQIKLYTDRFASRSVWFCCRKNESIVANFPAAILPFLDSRREIDEAGLWSLLATSRHVGSHGIFRNIHNLQAGQTAVLQPDGTFTITDWYERRYKPEYGKSPRHWGGVIAETLKGSVEKHKKTTSSPYLFLSGGLDSRLAAGAYGEELKTITLTTHPNMNSRISEQVARHLGQKHQTIIRTPYWYLDTFEASALIAGGNYNIAHSHFIVPVNQILESDSNASFLLGDLLENFNKHYFKAGDVKLKKMTARDIPDQFHKLFGFTHKNPKALQLLFKGDFGLKAYESWREELIKNYRRIEPVSDRIEDRLDALFRWDNCSICPTYLMLECILPFAPMRNLMFDNDMLDLLLTIPTEIRGAHKLHKWTLWHLDRKLAWIPDSNYWLPPVFPQALLQISRNIRPLIGKSRRKLLSLYKKGPITETEGSWHMNHVWYKKDSRYRAFIESRLLSNKSIFVETFNQEAILNNWNIFIAGDLKKLFEIETLLSLNLL